MDVRSLLRVTGRGVLASALMLTLCEVMAAAPAHADPEVILESPPITVGGGGNTLVVSQDITLSDPIIITNPGTTLNVEQQCTNQVVTGSFCLGTSDTLYPAGSNTPLDQLPVVVSGVPASPYRLPGAAMDWIEDEAVIAVAAQKGVEADDLVRTYARPEIRAYIATRINSILNKKLYGLPMSEPEVAAYDEVQAIFKEQLVKKSKWALEEYDAWSRNPCGYVPPAPPPNQTLLPAVPNDAANSTLCQKGGSRFAVWQITDGTPPADTFERWAAYRHPTPAMKALGDTRYKFALAQTYGAMTLALGFGIAIVAAIGVGAAISTVSAATATSIATALTWASSTVTVSAGIALTVALAAASLVVVLVGAILAFGIAIWQLVEDAKPGKDLRDRAANAAADDDALDIEPRMADYASLDFDTAEDPADASKKAYIHTDEFTQQLFTLVHDWQLFRQDGSLIPDPRSGYNSQGTTTASDVHFAENGVAKDLITVLAPPNTLNADNQLLSGYRVKISRGFLMVSELVTATQQFRPYEPRTNVRFVDSQGRLGIMSLVRVGQDNGPPVRQFLFTTVVDEKAVHSTSTSWTYQQNPGVLKTVTLLDQLPVTPQVNVIPSVQGELVADHVVNLKANASDPALTKTGGQYTWVVERLDDSGNVVDTFNPGGNLAGFGHRFDVPGNYRAKVTFAWTGPEPGSASGRVEFTIVRPAAEVMTAEVEDDRVDSDSLTLNLRLLQNTRGDGVGDEAEFDVDVDWADDGLGNVITQHYDVRCADTGFTTCETGPLIDQPSGGPTNAQWSSSPTFTIPDDQNFLPHVTVRVTNSYGETITRVFAIEGEHRPKYATMTPYVEMPAGTDTAAVDVVQVFPSDLFPPPSTPGIEQLQIQPFMQDLVDQLPPGVTPQLVQKPNAEWWLQLRGHPTADSIGQWTFYYPFEQVVDEGNFRRPAPALTTLEVVSSTTPGYRGIIRGAPQDLSDRSYRTEYPEWMVQAAERRVGDEGEFTDFAGTVMCKLEAGGNVVFDKPCTANGPFPWPQQLVPGSQFASVYLESDSQPISADGPYTVNLIGNFLDPSVTMEPVGRGDTTASVKLRVDDVASFLGVVPPPFSASGYQVSCSVDSGAFVPCLDSGAGTVASGPGNHTLDVKVIAPDDATVVRRATWNGGPVLSVGVTARPVTPSALKARFDLAVGYDGLVAPPYAAKGFKVACLADGKAAPCDSGVLSLLRVPGRHVLSVTAKAPTPDAQMATQKLTWRVATPRKKLTVAAPATASRGARMTVTAKGLLPREKYVVKLAGDKVAKGKASARGRVSENVLVPRSLAPGQVKVVVRGATDKRTGQDVVRVVAGRPLVGMRALDVFAG